MDNIVVFIILSIAALILYETYVLLLMEIQTCRK